MPNLEPAISFTSNSNGRSLQIQIVNLDWFDLFPLLLLKAEIIALSSVKTSNMFPSK